jgi:DNA-binding PadR family transcriptional regulator
MVDAGAAALYDRLVRVSLLLLLLDGPASSEDLRAGLRPLGLMQTVAAVEAALDELAAAGSVHGAQEPSADGRHARVYAMTADGGIWLRDAMTELRRTEVVLGGFLARCGECLLLRA